MKVLMLSQFYPPVIGGEERHVRNLALALTSRGHEVHVATQAVEGAGAGSAVEDGVHVHRVRGTAARVPALYSDGGRPHALPVPDPELALALGRIADRVDPDVVHAHNWIVNSWLPVQMRKRRPLVLTLHDYSDRCATKRLMYEGRICSGPGPVKCTKCCSGHYGPVKGVVTLAGLWVERPVKHRLVDRYLAVSRAVAEGNAVVEQALVVPNFVPDALVDAERRQRPDWLPQGPYLLFAGDVIREKGVHTLLDAYTALPAERPQLVLIGRPGPDTPQRLPDGVVHFPGRPHEEVVMAFQHALAAVLPSEVGDACPTTVLEAMALGAPVVTTCVGGMVDMVEDGTSGLLVPPAEPAALGAAIARLVRDAGLRQRLVAGARSRVRAFTASSVADRIEAVYAEVRGASS